MYFLKENHGLEICKIKKCLKETELQITFKDSKSVEEFIDNKFFELKEQKVTVLEVRKQDPETEIKIKKRVSETQV